MHLSINQDQEKYARTSFGNSKGPGGSLQEDEIKKAVGQLDSWFIRSPWLIKREFLFEILNHIQREGLEQIAYLLGPPTKDYNYSLASYMNYPGDRVPQDNFRQLDKKDLSQTRSSYLDWLRTLPQQQITNIAVGLTELGHCSLAMHVYNRTVDLLRSKRSETNKEPKLDQDWRSSNQLAAVETDSKDYKNCIRVIRRYNHFMDKLNNKIEYINDETNLTVARGRAKNKMETEISNKYPMDYIQLLPSWINKMIFSYLDEATLSKCEKVNPYWKKTVKELRSDIETRNKLNSLINSFPMFDPDNTAKPNGKKKSKGKDYSWHRSNSRKKIVKGSLMEKLKSDQSGKTFSKTYESIWTLNDYAAKRIVSVGKKWLAMSKEDEIVLFSLPTLSSSPCSLTGHEGCITGMAFHPEEAIIVSAATDSTIRTWEVWSRREVNQFEMSDVKKIVASQNCYITDGTYIIKAFNWKSTSCLWSVQVNKPERIKSIFISQSENVLYITKAINSNIVRYCGSTGELITEIPHEQATKINCLHSSDNYLVKVTEDGRIYILYICDKNETTMIAQRNFSRQITDVIFASGHLLALDNKGALHIWDPIADIIVTSVGTIDESMVVYSLHLLHHSDSCKVLINGEACVQVLNFAYERKQKNEPDLQGKAQPKKDRAVLSMKRQSERINELHTIRQSCHPSLRNYLEDKKQLNIPTKIKQNTSQSRENTNGV